MSAYIRPNILNQSLRDLVDSHFPGVWLAYSNGYSPYHGDCPDYDIVPSVVAVLQSSELPDRDYWINQLNDGLVLPIRDIRPAVNLDDVDCDEEDN